MATIILKYKLKPGVTREDFEAWVKTTDQPVMRGLKSVAAFDTYRVTGLLLGEGAQTADYVELFDIADLDAFTGTDMPGDTVQGIMGQFMGFADAPEFLLADKL